MVGTELLVAGCSLAFAVVSGLVLHEWLHALVLRLARIDYTITYGPDRKRGVIKMFTSCPWASVTPYPSGREPAWQLRIAALSPLLLVVPVLGIARLEFLSFDSTVVTAITIGWLACSIPSPQDFSVAFYAHEILESTVTREPDSPHRTHAD